MRDTDIKTIFDIMNPAKTVWIEIVDSNSSRFGSIGIAVPETLDPNDRGSWNTKINSNKLLSELKKILELKAKGGYVSYYSAEYYYKAFRFTLHFDDKSLKGQDWLKNNKKLTYKVLENYTGPSVFNFNKVEKREVPKKYDMMGHEIELGDFGVIAYGKDDLRFGNVFKISPVGAVYVRTLKTETNRYSYEVRLKL